MTRSFSGPSWSSSIRIDAEAREELETRLLTADVGIEATEHILSDLHKKVDRKELADVEALIAAARRGRAEALLAVGHVVDATAELEAHLAAAPLDEGGWASLMVAQNLFFYAFAAVIVYSGVRVVTSNTRGDDVFRARATHAGEVCRGRATF